MKKTNTRHTILTHPPSPSSESIAALACGMADDFNNILTTVLGACSLIDMDDPANSELLQYVALIRVSAERAAVLSDRLARVCTKGLDDACSGSRPQVSISADTSVSDKKASDGIVSSKNIPGGTPV